MMPQSRTGPLAAVSACALLLALGAGLEAASSLLQGPNSTATTLEAANVPQAPTKITRAHTNQTSDTNSAKKGEPKATITYQTKWFMQLVDHFTWANQDTWLQRYLVNTDHWCGSNCPILFYTGNEGDIEVFANNTGWMWENAQQLHAMLVFAEHRFYGHSMPYKIDPTKVGPNQTHTLGYLSSEQALADFARLIYELKNTIFDAKHSAVITVGGSYGGMLAAWMRMKYPNLVDGALAGSAPILQFPGEYQCQEFNKIVTRDYENYSPYCSKAISKSWSVIRSMANQPAGPETLSRLFNSCSKMSQDDVELLTQLLNSIWVNMAMTDYANEATFLSKMPAYPIKHACDELKFDPVQVKDEFLLGAIANASQVYTNYTKQTPCLDVRKWVFDPMDVLWDFQTCTEMVMPICSDGINDMFEPQPFNLSDFVQGCKSRWGVQTQVSKIQTLYGNNRSLHSSSNIIFSSCSRDPWSAGCPQDSIESNQIHAIKIHGACHHEDLRPAGPNDSQVLEEARHQELNIITDWIRSHYERVQKFTPSETLVWTNRSE